MARRRAKAESSSVEETIENAEGIEPGNVVSSAVVQSTTEETPSPADETSMPNELNTEHEQPPVRTSKPDTPIAQTLTAGAGEHTPPDPDEFDAEGRPRGDEPDEPEASSDDDE